VHTINSTAANDRSPRSSSCSCGYRPLLGAIVANGRLELVNRRSKYRGSWGRSHTHKLTTLQATLAHLDPWKSMLVTLCMSARMFTAESLGYCTTCSLSFTSASNIALFTNHCSHRPGPVCDPMLASCNQRMLVNHNNPNIPTLETLSTETKMQSM